MFIMMGMILCHQKKDSCLGTILHPLRGRGPLLVLRLGLFGGGCRPLFGSWLGPFLWGLFMIWGPWWYRFAMMGDPFVILRMTWCRSVCSNVSFLLCVCHRFCSFVNTSNASFPRVIKSISISFCLLFFWDQRGIRMLCTRPAVIFSISFLKLSFLPLYGVDTSGVSRVDSFGVSKHDTSVVVSLELWISIDLSTW